MGGAVLPVGPAPVQPGGPEVLVGTMGPRTIRHAAGWADGLAGVTLDLDTGAVSGLFELAREAWTEAGRGRAAADHLVLVRAGRARRGAARRCTGTCGTT